MSHACVCKLGLLIFRRLGTKRMTTYLDSVITVGKRGTLQATAQVHPKPAE